LFTKNNFGQILIGPPNDSIREKMKLANFKQGLCQGYFAFTKACYYIENDTKKDMIGLGLNRLIRTWQILFNDKLWQLFDKKCHLADMMSSLL